MLSKDMCKTQLTLLRSFFSNALTSLVYVYSAMFRHKIFIKLGRKHPPIVEQMSKVSAAAVCG